MPAMPESAVEGWVNDWLRPGQARANAALEHALQRLLANVVTDRLTQALRYSVLQGGKRLRPLLCFAAYECVTGETAAGTTVENTASYGKRLDAVAAAIEFVHCYSLIHDDLPAMDDDELRRGQASCHVAFDEATAILAGDALQAMAFELLGDVDTDAATRIVLINTLASAIGPAGMVGGQMLDIEAEHTAIQAEQLETLHRQKTGALINAALTMGATFARAGAGELNALREYGNCVGLAFQVIDDILDVEGDTAQLGKPQGADARQGKTTYPDLLGMDAAKSYASELEQQALQALAIFAGKAEPLRQLAHYIVARQK